MNTVHEPTVSDEPHVTPYFDFDRLIELEEALRGLPPEPWAA